MDKLINLVYLFIYLIYYFTIMKKIIFILLCLPFINSVVALSSPDFLVDIPDNFKNECFKNYSNIGKLEVSKTYKVNLNNTRDLVFTQSWSILPYKYFSKENSIYKYSSNILWDSFTKLNDNNLNTFVELDTKITDELILEFDKKIEKWSFLNFNYNSSNLNSEYYISDNKKIWDKIKKENIDDFSFSYIKIKFINKDLVKSENYREVIKVYELSFINKKNIILLKSFFNENIEVFSQFNCKQKDFRTFAWNYNDFPIDLNTQVIDIDFEENPSYNLEQKNDVDFDNVEDELDNCKYIYNPKQKDKNWDKKGDLCSDDDKDGHIWFFDNCVYISNNDQRDVNNNWIWDVCEFDKDKDWIFDSIDNCVTLVNEEQLDEDNDGIWDICDNCKKYNPRQFDKNWNWIWDICEQEQEYIEKNDKDNDTIIDSNDNCKDISNFNQLDKDNDGIWDVCDNCLEVVNSNQNDLNENGIWDFCEDWDWDWYLWYLDNCINTNNPEQTDDDNDWIGNVCEDKDKDNIIFNMDNCPYVYNPEQLDIDKDNVWDKCDDKDNRYVESNKTFFIALLIFITVVFLFWIASIVRKLK